MELAKSILSFSSQLICRVTLSQERSHAPWEPARERVTRVSHLLYFVVMTDNTPGVQIYSVEAINVSLLFVQYLRLGHYLKIPPSIASGVTVLCRIVVKEWMFDILQP